MAQASKRGTEQVASSDGMLRVPDGAKRQSLKIGFALVTPDDQFLLGNTEDEVAINLHLVEDLGWRDLLLMLSVLDRLTEGTLTDEDRKLLVQERPAQDLLEAIAVHEQGPEALLQRAEEEDLGEVWAVALRVPQVLTSDVPMGIIRKLAAQIDLEREQMTEGIARAMLTALAGGQTGKSVDPEEALQQIPVRRE
jgi:hypothetical protein